ncbi:GRIP domain containing protein [Novymonas esmeraldas]|uniref:GRIP domain containing protein n=1 Tax=Novymonas esmeraldas TaxID=1808958 RepID=A0AAW0EVC4_9TRYP
MSASASEAAMAPTAATGSDGVALSNSPAATNAEVELAQLRQELKRSQEKFSSWQAKAKAGVDQMRAQVLDLTHRLEMANQQQAHTLATDTRGASRLTQFLEHSSDILSAHALAAASLLIDTSPSAAARVEGYSRGGGAALSSSASTPPAQDAAASLVESLQKTVRDQADRIKETHHALKRATKELQQRTAAVHQQDESLAVLKRRVAALEATNTSLEGQLMNVPNAEEWRVAQEELDNQLTSARLECENRESQLVLQHSIEVQALSAAHELEVRELQLEHSEALAQAVRDALMGGSRGADGRAPASNSANATNGLLTNGGGPRGRDGEDSAYMGLLREYEAVERQCAAVIQERDAMEAQQKALLRELQDLVCQATDTPASGSHGGTAEAWKPLAEVVNLEAAARLIADQRHRCVALHEDLVRTRAEVGQLRRAKTSPPVDGLGAQQLQYVRSVVVQLLCSLNDARVARNLLPVLSMLLKFTDDDLASITKAIPQWTTRR